MGTAARRAIGALGSAVLAAGTVLAGTVAGAAAAPPAACTATWAGGHGSAWSTAANWVPNGVPTRTSVVCVLTPNGPTVPIGATVAVAQVNLTGTSLTLDGTLTARTAFAVRSSTISGVGTFVSQSSASTNALNGTRLDGVTIDATAGGLNVSGSTTACGTRYALCLSGAARLLAGTVGLAGGSIGGPTTARPAVTATDVVEDSPFGRAALSRVQVELSAARLVTDRFGDPLAALQVDDWDQLSDTGVLSGKLLAATGAIVLPRTITTLDSTVTAYNSITTVAGTNAYDDLTSISARGSLAVGTQVAQVGPVGGVLTNSGSLTFFNGTTWQIHTDVVNGGDLTLLGSGTVDGAVTNQATGTITGGLQASAVRNAGRVDIKTTMTTSSYTQSRGKTMIDTAAHIQSTGFSVQRGGLQVGLYSVIDTDGGKLTLGQSASLTATQFTCRASIQGVLSSAAGGNSLDVTLADNQVSCPELLSVSGVARLPSTLNLTSVSPTVGDRIVLIDAPAGFTGRFGSVTGATVGTSHWQIDYTTTQVVATLVAS